MSKVKTNAMRILDSNKIEYKKVHNCYRIRTS